MSNIYSYKTLARLWAAALLVVALVFGAASCAGKSGAENTVQSPSTTVAPVTSETPSITPGSAEPSSEAKTGETLYEKFGLTIAIPNTYIDRLMVFTEPKWEMLDDTYLISVYEKQSYEESLKDYGGEDGAGFLFSIARYTQAQYEQFLSSDGSGQSFFARDDTYYYGWFTATDVQFYRSGGEINTESDDWKSWTELWERCGDIKADFITRNQLTAYDDSEFWDREFTYDGAHLYMTYYPYYAYQDTAEAQGFTWQDVDYTLVLSQPATQGDKGIWCVERWFDNKYGNLYYEFPYESAQAAADYYAALQSAADSGGDTSMRSPVNAALAFVKQHFDHQAATTDSFKSVAGEPAGNVWKLCREVFDDMGTFQGGYYKNGEVGALEQYEVPEHLMPFGNYAGSRLYPIIWIKSEEPAMRTGDVIFCRNKDGSKTLSFFQDDNLLCVNLGGFNQWFKPAYVYASTPYDRMQSFYEEFARA